MIFSARWTPNDCGSCTTCGLYQLCPRAGAAQFITLTARDRLPATYSLRDYVIAGGLMSYGADLAEIGHQVGVYAGKILKGAKPADLPVLQSTKFNFAINLQTARVLGIDVPSGLLSIADEVIE